MGSIVYSVPGSGDVIQQEAGCGPVSVENFTVWRVSRGDLSVQLQGSIIRCKAVRAVLQISKWVESKR